MDLVQGILSTAQAIGANPLDLATVISYETGGTFDPLQAGPTTQWGQHRGLIQFGEPQAQQYGVDWNDPLGSQLGPNGAVANYLRGSGYQPGMGLLDLYSTINAGAPGRYNASDANNGGAPGTVADKVNEQMAQHRANAERLLGQQMAATPLAAGHNQPQGLLGTVSTSGAQERQPGIFDALLGRLPAPVANRLGNADWRDNMTLALAGMSMNPNQALIGSVQRRMDNRDEQRRINETVQWLQSMGRTDLAEAVAAGSLQGSDAAAIALTPVQATAEQARASVILQDGTTIQSTDTGVRVYSPTGGELTGQAAADAIAAARAQEVADQRAVYEARRSGTLGADINMGGDAAFATAQGSALGTIAGERQGSASTQIANADIALQGINDIMNHPALGGGFLDGGTGASSYMNMVPGTPGYDFQNRVKQLSSGAFLTAIQQLQGMGALSNAEGQTATAALARLDTGLSEQDFIAALNDYKRIVEAGRARAEQQLNGGISTAPLGAQAPAASPTPTSAEIQALLDKYAPGN